MKRIAYLGAAAVLLACAPALAQEAVTDETAATPEATVANEVTSPDASVAAEETVGTTDAEEAADAVASTPGDPVVCKRGKTERHVNVVSPGTEGRVCEMHYAKPTEGVPSRMIWYATSDKNFCDQKANSLMAKLTSSGWTCTNPDGTPVSVEASAPAEPAVEAVTAPESAPAEADHPAEPEEPADAPEGSEEPSEEGDSQE